MGGFTALVEVLLDRWRGVRHVLRGVDIMYISRKNLSRTFWLLPGGRGLDTGHTFVVFPIFLFFSVIVAGNVSC